MYFNLGHTQSLVRWYSIWFIEAGSLMYTLVQSTADLFFSQTTCFLFSLTIAILVQPPCIILVHFLLFVSLWFRHGINLSLLTVSCSELILSVSCVVTNSLLFCSYFLSVSGSVTTSVFHFDSLFFSTIL